MALTQLAPPYPIFTDKSGSPLDNGYLYFGEVNKNPETNPIQVYYDSAFTQPAAQPLRTSNGYVMRNGSPALIYADSQFSVTIRDKNNALVIYSPVGYGVDPSSVTGNVRIDDFIGDGSTTIFTLSTSAGTKRAVDIYIDGVYQEKASYEVLGTTLTFSEAPPLNSSIEVETFENSVLGVANAANIDYDQGGTGYVQRTVEGRLRDLVSVKDFGAVGDGVTNDTAAIQAAFDSGAGGIYFPSGTYMVGNLTLPDNQCTIYGEAKWKTRIKALSGALSTDNYMLASSAYVNNATSGSVQTIIKDLWIDGDNLVERPLVIYSFWTEINNCRIQKPKGTSGGALVITSTGIGGANCSSTLVENKVLNCRLDGTGSGGGYAFRMVDSTAKCTDMFFNGNLVLNGISDHTTMAGHNITDNHFYGGSVVFRKLSVGTIIADNYFENTLTLNDFKDEVVILASNSFSDRVTVSFGNDGRDCIFNNCTWRGTADVYHDYFSPLRDLIVNGGSFETATPVVFSNPSSTGWVRFNNVWSYATATFLNGSRKASPNSIRSTFNVPNSVSANRGDTDTTFVWVTSETTQRFTSTLTANRTVTLSTDNALNGAKARFVRTGGGAFTLDIGGLKTLASSEWCEIEYDGSAWVLTAFGSL